MNQKKTSMVLLYGLILIIGMSWGLSFMATALLMRAGLQPVQIQAARWLIAAIFFGILVAVGKVRPNLRDRNLKYMLLCGILEPCIYMLLETYGLKFTSASTASVVIATIPCMTLIVRSVFLHERTSRTGILSILLAVTGVIICTVCSPTFELSGQAVGFLLLFCAVLTGSFYSIFSAKAAASYTPYDVTATMCFLGVVWFTIMNFAAGYGVSTYVTVFRDFRLIFGILFLGLACSALCFIAYNSLISRVDPAIANNLSGAAPTIVGVLAGILILGDAWGLYTVIGLILTVAGVILSSHEVK
ncbi:MAG: DMT family transporter [Mogibacterium sp.]|nr:DMT family transporter [Mogibacterium sp.]